MSDQSRLIHLKNQSPDLSEDDDADLSFWSEDVGIISNGSRVINVSNSGSTGLTGNLSKWTNYIHGWQDRYFALKSDGSLVYYKSSNDTDFGCRGAISIQKAEIKPHGCDELRFDVSVNDCNWYLRAKSVEDRQMWIDALEAHKQRHNMEMQDNLRRHGSAMSLSSNSISNSSSRPGGSAKGGRGLTEKLAELETFRDILCRQIDTLQSYFDACAEGKDINPTSKSGLDQSTKPSSPVDFKGEAITFKATTAGILATLSHCIDIMTAREECWKRKLEKEVAQRKALEEKYKNALEFSNNSMAIPSKNMRNPLTEPPLNKLEQMKSVPDYEEGPHSQIGEDEFFDAVENELDRLQEEQQSYDKLRNFSVDEKEVKEEEVEEMTRKHHLWPEIDKVTKEQLHYARLLPGDVWELFAEDGEMRMYKREEETSDGMVVDPLKALHQVRGVTARELCHFFFSPDVRMEWETTLDQATVLEKISNDTLLFLQLHKRIWPAAQRDACFWSHLRKVTRGESKLPEAHDTYVVCNKSAVHSDAPVNQNGVLRVDLTVSFVCDTIIDENKRNFRNLDEITRDDISCKITYCSVINPMGWAPASVLRTVYKREYPRFLKRFTEYVINKTKHRQIMW